VPEFDYDQPFIWVIYFMLVATVLSGMVHWMARLGYI
jgi:hypothetical protein